MRTRPSQNPDSSVKEAHTTANERDLSVFFEANSNEDPLKLFSKWFDAAQRAGVTEPNAMALGTSNLAGRSRVRMVLLKDRSQKGFCFFTNYRSKKSEDLLENPNASLCFHWRQPFHRQVRIVGTVTKALFEESERYFHSRAWGSQVAAATSPQSQPIESREVLDQMFSRNEDRWKDQPVPLPEHWGGFWVSPTEIEFWQEQDFRRHDRWLFLRDKEKEPWTLQRLAP